MIVSEISVSILLIGQARSNEADRASPKLEHRNPNQNRITNDESETCEFRCAADSCFGHSSFNRHSRFGIRSYLGSGEHLPEQRLDPPHAVSQVPALEPMRILQ